MANLFMELQELHAKKIQKRRKHRRITRLSAWWAKWKLIVSARSPWL